MKWKDLLSQNRVGEEIRNEKIGETDPLRNSYEKDYDRIIFSTYFKRLQNKTQVFPFPENTIIHNRLTHSIETSVVGRSLGKYVGSKVLERENIENISLYDFGEIVSTACLFHDIGNPPFGHSGENSISDFFEGSKTGQDFISKLDNEKQINDFYKFEGNAQGLRIIFDNDKVLPLTHAVIGSFCKYPREICETLELEREIKKLGISKKKNGIFQSEIALFNNIAHDLGLIRDEAEKIISYFRHPLSYLVEASDDICYRLMDLEDAVRLGILKIDEVKEMMMPIIKHFYKIKGEEKGLINFEEKFKNIKTANSKIEYLRSKVMGILIEEIGNAFMRQYDDIMNGTLYNDLFYYLDERYKKALDFIKSETTKKVFSFHPIMEIEAAGYEIIGGLLECFIGSILYETNRYKQYFELLPNDIKHDILNDDNFYNKGRIIIDYISGMTDNFALNLYKKIKGIELPKIY